MSYHFSSIFLLLISNIYLFNVLALTSENIVGGFYADNRTFKYQVAIIAKRNFTNLFTLICGGSIIHANFVLTAAHCVYNNRLRLDGYSLAIRAGTNNLTNILGYEIEIDQIYLPKYDDSIHTNDFAVAKLRKSLILENNEFVAKVDLPSPYKYISGRKAIVSGYGFHKIRVFYDIKTKTLTRLNGETDLRLKYGYVYILKDFICKNNYYDIDPIKQICGLMMTRDLKLRWGICSLDSGGPLVINNTIVGVISRNPHDCNDTRVGCVYTKVSAYVNIIRNIIWGKIPPDFFIYYNPPHVLQQSPSSVLRRQS